jgi:hypothetical protein
MTREDGLPLGRALVASIAATVVLIGAGCDPLFDPYEGKFDKGDNALGVVDPVNFPAANLGDGGNRMMPGNGVFMETPAFADGAEVGYFPYLYPATPTAASLRVRDNGNANPRVPTVGAFIFDATGAPPNPLPATQKCTAPTGYAFDQIRDEVHYDQQGSVFASLPGATYNPGEASTSPYLPIVTEWPVSSAGQPCQRFKSRAQTEAALGRMPSGRFAAWLIIDPAAAVYKFSDDPNMDPRGLDLQKWGWFNRYLLAYLDGGYIPTTEMMVTEAGVTKPVVVMNTQRLFYPRSPVITMGANGMPAMASVARGDGLDVLEAKRADADYSPVCQVFTYDTGTPMPPEMLPKRVEDIMMLYGASIMPAAVPYIFCLQVR